MIDERWPSSRLHALVELIIVTPLEALLRLATVIAGPARMRRLNERIQRRGGSCDH